MKNVYITGATLVPGPKEGESTHIDQDSIVSLDDNVALQVCAAGRGKLIADDDLDAAKAASAARQKANAAAKGDKK